MPKARRAHVPAVDETLATRGQHKLKNMLPLVVAYTLCECVTEKISIVHVHNRCVAFMLQGV
jgi:hypothetical protein